MANPGDEIIDVQGGKIIFKETAASSNGQLLEIEAHYPANSELPPEHYHPYQEERFQVLEGTIRAIVNGQENLYKPGQDFTIPPGTPHAMQNVNSEEGRVIWQTRPAMKTEFFHETIRKLSKDGNISTKERSNMLQLAVIFREYKDEFRLNKPPYLVQFILFGILSPIGRLRGYKARYTGETTISGDKPSRGLKS
jgi:mannose-6-phosphate isomerase-like protein (cupin superfamily)